LSRSRLLLTALTAALALAAAISTASARRLEISNTGIRAVFAELTFANTAAGEGIEAICPVTLEGSFHSRTISKVTGQLIGFITRAIEGTCVGTGGAEAFGILQASLPWHIRYDSFEGALPNIAAVRTQFIGLSFGLRILAVECLYKSEKAKPAYARFRFAAGESTGLRFDETREVGLFMGGLNCPQNWFLRGTSTPVTILGTRTVIIIHLIL
jgi:hypothetical protein